MAEFVANGHVRITGAKLTQDIVAPNIKKAAAIGQEWAHENDLVYDGVETAAEWLACDIRESRPAPEVTQ